ncbi:glycosyltransferase family protein [Microbacterium elymi]|uniref:Glycosyltransferase family protein n=1 Tax=Microbacterium elymi TaxID=2909587 RepID=A0ABY5NH98_9MICO|nr:glycosyltransferase family protein [Microbacterium elymi]UUT34484.1 glycosyltransferase family protein [Microbacterium elymi]
MSDDATAPAEGARTPVSIVCVFNDPDVLASCLQRSIDAGRVDASETQFLPVDNRDGVFATAGAALNHGAAQAENDVIVFVHQDVYLHSLVELERVAGELLADASVGVVGAAGIDAHKRIQGRIRDRVIALGAAAPTWRDVESMDEVLFMITRRQWADEPLADQASLGWHAYAVEYSARMRSRGRRAAVRDIPLTHNSLTVNLDRLDVAHRWVGDAYPGLLPLQTTCGTIEAGGSPGGWSRLAPQGTGPGTVGTRVLGGCPSPGTRHPERHRARRRAVRHR